MGLLRGLQASVSAVNPVVSVSAVNPVVSVSAVTLVVRVFFDAAGRFRILTEIVTLSDATAYAVAKQLSDSATLSDTLALQTAKSLGDSVSLSDAALAITSFSRGFSNMIEAVDEGLLVMQNYCDTTYFAEDYVGQSRIFS